MNGPSSAADVPAPAPRANRAQRRAEARKRKKAEGRPGKAGSDAAPAALLATAVEHHQAGRLHDAQALYRRILEARPDHADALHLLGVTALQAGDAATAVDLISRALIREGGVADYHNNLGLALTAQGRLAEAVASFEGALALAPDHAVAHNNLGNALKALGRTVDALAAYRGALAIDPDYAEAHNNMGNALTKLGRPEEALPAYRRALALNPGYADAHSNLGNALQALGRLEDAMAGYREALRLRPDFAEAHNNLGGALLEARQAEAAQACFERAILARDDYAEAFSNLGNAYRELGRLGEAHEAIEHALALKPDLVEAHTNLGNVLSGMGRADEAIERHRAALALEPEGPAAYRCLLLAMLYGSAHDNEALFAEHRRFAARHAPRHVEIRPAETRPHDNDRDPDRRLRVGYLSSDFRQHPVGHNILPALENHDHARFEVFCYADVPHPDEMTARFRALADHWRPTAGARDEAVAEAIRADRIDILVCTAAHLDRNRPGVLAYRPAPVQVSWHDAATTGLETVDYLLTDAVIHPLDTTERFTEELVRLPVFYAYPPIEGAPEVAPPPVLEAGHIAFGSFNNPTKLTPETVALWSRVLAAVPGSRLVLKYKSTYGCPATRGHFERLFAGHGIAGGRLEFLASRDHREHHLGHYARIDIALDTFPFAGVTTTFEALWMGVPVIARMGDRLTARTAGSILTHAGLGELAAEDDEEFVARARALAADRTRLGELRATLRERVAASPLCDGPAHAANIERAWRWMWRRHCGAEPAETPFTT